MCDGDDSSLLLDCELTQKIHDDSGTLGIERCCQLVGQNDARLVGECAGDGVALRPTPRILYGSAICLILGRGLDVLSLN